MNLLAETIGALNASNGDISRIYEALFRFARQGRESGMRRADVAATLGICIARSSLPTWQKNRLPDLFVRVDGCVKRIERSKHGRWWLTPFDTSFDVGDRCI